MADTSTYTVTGSGPLAALNDVQTIGLGPGVIGGTLRIRGSFTGTISFTSDPGTGTYAAQTLTNLSGSNASSFAGVGGNSAATYLIPAGIVGLKATMTAYTSGNVVVSWDYSAFNTPVDRNLEALKQARREAILKAGRAFIVETVPYGSVNGSALMTTGTLYGITVPLLAGELISNVSFALNVIGVSVTLAKFSVFTKSGALLGAATADLSAVMNGTTGIKTAALGTAFTAPVDDVYYVSGIAVGAGTQPTLLMGQGAVNITTGIGSGVINSVVQGGQTDIPASATFTGSSSARTFWVALS